MKLEFDYGGRTFLIEKDIGQWNIHYVKANFSNKVSLEKDLLTGDDMYVAWDLVGVIRRPNDRGAQPQALGQMGQTEPVPVGGGAGAVKLEFDHGGRTFLIERDIGQWNIHYVKANFSNKVSLEKDLLTGDDMYVAWDLVGVIRRPNEGVTQPEPAAVTVSPLPARQTDSPEPAQITTEVDPAAATEQPQGSQPRGKDAEKLAEASDPDTSPARLNQLARMMPAARIHAARNPSCPPSLMTWLAELKDPAIDEALRSR